MGWTTPVDTRATGYTVSATDWDQVQDNLLFLFGDAAWTTVSAFTNSWVAGQTVRYILLGRVVYLDGWIQTGTGNTAAFTLPAGYRPSANRNYATQTGTSGTTNSVLVGTDGTVKPFTSTSTWLSGISFPTV